MPYIHNREAFRQIVVQQIEFDHGIVHVDAAVLEVVLGIPKEVIAWKLDLVIGTRIEESETKFPQTPEVMDWLTGLIVDAVQGLMDEQYGH